MYSLFISLLLMLLTACSDVNNRNIGKEQDSAPKNPSVDINAIENAVPKNEPFSQYGNPETYQVFGETYRVLKTNHDFRQKGDASWYGTKFHGQRASSGETYDMYAMTAAHKTLPLPTYVKVTNLDNNKQIIVKVNDRGPFHDGRIIDLSYVAALKLDIVKHGTGRVAIEAFESTAVLKHRKKRVYVQMGTFSNKENAQRLQRKLVTELIDSDIYEVMRDANATLYRVRIGPYSQREEANKMQAKVASLGVADAKVFTDHEE